MNNINIIMQGEAHSPEFEVPCVWDGNNIPWAIYCRHIQGLMLNNVQVEWDGASGHWQGALKCENVDDLEIDAFRGKQFKEQENPSAITLTNCRRSFVHNCNAPLKTSTFLAVEGRETEATKVLSNNLANTDKPFEISEDVEERAFCQMANILPD